MAFPWSSPVVSFSPGRDSLSFPGTRRQGTQTLCVGREPEHIVCGTAPGPRQCGTEDGDSFAVWLQSHLQESCSGGQACQLGLLLRERGVPGLPCECTRGATGGCGGGEEPAPPESVFRLPLAT